MPTIILASGSRYRQSLLCRLRLPFIAIAPNIDETPLPLENPADTALRLATEKAYALRPDHPDGLIIGSDQVAEFSGRILGKPKDLAEAKAQLRYLSGKVVFFHTALAVLNAEKNQLHQRLVTTVVEYRKISEAQINTYLAREPATDSVGSTKSEGLGIVLLKKMQSDDPTAMIGLPLIALTEILAKEGVDALHAASALEVPQDLNSSTGS